MEITHTTTQSNLELFREAMGHPGATYYEVARHCNTTVEDVMCCIGLWRSELLARAEA